MSARSQFRTIVRFGPSLALAGAAVLLAVGFLVSNYQDRLFRAQQDREVTVQGRILAASITASLAFDDEAAAQEYVNALKINPEIEAVAVYDARHRLFASFVRNGARAVPRALASGDAPPQSGRMTVVLPVRQSSSPLGAVYVRAIAEPTERRFARYAAIMLLSVMAALLVAVMGTTQRALRGVNVQLEERAVALADANRALQSEMAEREKAEEALRQSQKMEAVGQLSGGVAHDFNNLLTIIKGSLHLLQKRIAQGSVDVQRYIDSANEGIDRAANLTRRLLAFSRRQPLSPTPVNLSELAGGMREMIHHSVGERVQVDWTLNARRATVCDANQMENVILNLAINARDAMPDGGTLTVETADLRLDAPDAALEGAGPGDFVLLRVSDTGIGMSEEVRNRALDPFFTTKPQGRGTGLGLSMAFGFIRQSNGLMSIESAPGKGTTIVILMVREATDTGSREAA